MTALAREATSIPASAGLSKAAARDARIDIARGIGIVMGKLHLWCSTGVLSIADNHRYVVTILLPPRLKRLILLLQRLALLCLPDCQYCRRFLLRN